MEEKKKIIGLAEKYRLSRKAADTAQPSKLNQWLSAHHQFILGFIILSSLLLRGWYFHEVKDTVLIDWHQWTETDMNFFHNWADSIAAGDIWTDQRMRPTHSWHKDVVKIAATEYAEKHTWLKTIQQPDSLSQADIDFFWDKMLGEKTFYQEPFYAYWLAANYALFDHPIYWIFFWQILLGTCINVLIYLVTKEIFDEKTAVLAAILAIFCGPLMMYNLVLLRATWLAFFSIGLVYGLQQIFKKTSKKRWAAYGIFIGLALMMKSIFWLWIPIVLLIVALQVKWNIPKLAKMTLPLILGIALGLLPTIVRNYQVNTPLMSLSNLGGLNFGNTNHADFKIGSTGNGNVENTAHFLMESEGKLLPSAMVAIENHASFGSYIGHVWKKFTAIWHWQEYANNSNFYFYKAQSNALQFTFITFWLIAPLSILGLLLTIGIQHKINIPIVGVIVLHIALLTSFFLVSRLRLPLLPLLIPFAAYTLTYIFSNFNWKGIAVILGIVSLLFFIGKPLPKGFELIRIADYGVGYQDLTKPTVQEAYKTEDYDKGISAIEKYLKAALDWIAEGNFKGIPKTPYNRQLANLFADVYSFYSDLTMKAKDFGTGGVAMKRSKDLKAFATR